MKNSSIYLGASEVAAAAGLNPYKTPDGLLARTYRARFHKESEVIDAELEASRVDRKTLIARAGSSRESRALVNAASLEEAPAKRTRILKEAAVVTSLELEKIIEEQVAEVSSLCHKAKETVLLTRASVEETASELSLCRERTRMTREDSAARRLQLGHALDLHTASPDDAILTEAWKVLQVKTKEAETDEINWNASLKDLEIRSVTAEKELVSAELSANAALSKECSVLQLRESSAELGPEIRAALCSEVATNRGSEAEARAIASRPGFVPQQRKMKYRDFWVHGTCFKLGGSVDGRHAETGEMLEVKNRQYKLFGRLPEYEKVQVLTYLYIYQESVCHVRECFREEANDFLVSWNEQEFRRLVETGLQDFKNRLDSMTNDENFRRKILGENGRVG
jgi:hypothetical protein